MATRTLGIAALLLLLVPTAVAHAAPEPARAPAPGAPQRAALAKPDVNLPSGWRESSDLLVTGAGDQDGFHLHVAREKDAFAWSTLATLNGGMREAGTWTGSVCLTGSGRYAVAVYAPAAATNKPALMNAGGLAAVVDVRTGATRRLPGRYSLAYFNPACGPGDRVLLTRAIGVDQQKTDLIGVAAGTATITETRRIDAQLTTPAAGPDGDFGIVRGALVKVDKGGALSTVGRPGGRPYAVRVTGGGAIDLLTVQQQAGGERAVAYRYADGKQRRVGDAARTDLELFGLSDGRNALVGDVSGISKGLDDLATFYAGRNPVAVSRQGHLLALSAAAQQRQATPSMRVTVQATRTGAVSSGDVTRTGLAAADVLSNEIEPEEQPLPADPGLPECAIPRNSLRHQVLQPSANQIEWAVDLAVQGRLTVQRPANYLKTGLPAYTPQGLFPLPANSPRVPAQLFLAILAQETNLYQGSWHGVPGDVVNPLVSDYYGIRADPDGEIEKVAFASADCGYGVSQVTDGMRVGSTKFNNTQRVAIATDYAANIAAGLQILVEKWNQLQTAGVTVNNNDPRYIENWFLAVWGYNSGIYPRNGSNPYGVGWFNNPANPTYPANRQPFLRVSKDDAAVPSRWPYPEKIMGWAEVPQWQWIDPLVKYSKPLFGSDTGDKLTLPGRYQFCGPVNNCSATQPANPCPAVNSTCWWHGYTSWLESNSQKEFATENLVYPVGSAEPPLIRTYPTACTPFSGPPGTLVVDDLTSSAENVLCSGSQAWGGKFTLRIGYPSGYLWTDYAAVDLHQISGYFGHAWFTHAYDPEVTYPQGGVAKNYHQVVGTWTPNITTAGTYEIVAHLPSHGANIPEATYLIDPNSGLGEPWKCKINQQAVTEWEDHWVHLGTYPLRPGARVQLDNMIQNATGTVDIAYDAIAFVPKPSGGHNCRDTVS
ncbi:golvesin C-terminal-like domain-containing protein [Micromonospora sp. CPCC 206061]|uniref:golvesin C-terminal-like domain-containing protein n=1 Tax=Micromonospora sp. CPCC 206061 TaxID=3122410 RepID=UPI002FF1CC78